MTDLCPYCEEQLTQMILDDYEGLRYVCERCGYPFYEE